MKLTALINIAGSLPSYFGIFGVRRELDLESLPGITMLELDPGLVTENIDEFKAIFEENRGDFLS